jgi:hypothetical protein
MNIDAIGLTFPTVAGGEHSLHDDSPASAGTALGCDCSRITETRKTMSQDDKHVSNSSKGCGIARADEIKRNACAQ